MFTKNDNTKFVLHHTTGYPDALWQYRNGSLIRTIAIDNTYDAVYWCNRTNMSISEFVRADDDNVYAIWTNPDTELIVALPVHDPAVIAEVFA